MGDRRALWIFAAAAVGILGLFAMSLNQERDRSVPLIPTVLPTDPVRGSPGAAATIISFGDFQCPFCREQEAVFAQLHEEFPQDLRIVWKDLPLTALHREAMPAALAARCAQDQGKFWEYHDALYDNQSALGRPLFEKTAAEVGLNLGDFQTCYNEQKQLTLVAAGQREAAALGISSTPYFYLNGRPFDGLTSKETLVTALHAQVQTP